MARDSKKSAMYRAEREALMPMEHRFKSKSEIRAFMRRVVKSGWFDKHFSNTTYRATFRWHWRINFESRLRNTALGGGGVVYLPSRECWAWTDRVILHEIAHSCAPSGHGPAFCRAYLALVGRFMDGGATVKTAAGRRGWRERAARELRAAYGRNNVDMIDHRKVKLAAERMRNRSACAAPRELISPSKCTAVRTRAHTCPESGMIDVDERARHRCAECGEWIDRGEPFITFNHSFNGNGNVRPVMIHARWCRESDVIDGGDIPEPGDEK